MVLSVEMDDEHAWGCVYVTRGCASEETDEAKVQEMRLRMQTDVIGPLKSTVAATKKAKVIATYVARKSGCCLATSVHRRVCIG